MGQRVGFSQRASRKKRMCSVMMGRRRRSVLARMSYILRVNKGHPATSTRDSTIQTSRKSQLSPEASATGINKTSVHQPGSTSMAPNDLKQSTKAVHPSQDPSQQQNDTRKQDSKLQGSKLQGPACIHPRRGYLHRGPVAAQLVEHTLLYGMFMHVVSCSCYFLSSQSPKSPAWSQV